MPSTDLVSLYGDVSVQLWLEFLAVCALAALLLLKVVLIGAWLYIRSQRSLAIARQYINKAEVDLCLIKISRLQIESKIGSECIKCDGDPIGGIIDSFSNQFTDESR